MRLLFPILFLLAACFSTRNVETPDSGISNWVSPTDYATLLANFQNAVANRNTQNYLRCFSADSMTFLPAASLSNQPVWRTWALRDEQAYFENVLQNLVSQSGNTLTLNQVDIRDVTPTSLRYVGDYRLTIAHKDSTLTRLFRGQVQFVMRLNAFNEWEIRRWEDVETHPDSSWSALKIRFVQ